MKDFIKLMIFLIVLSIVETLAIIFLKECQKTKKLIYFSLGVFFYIIIAALLVYLFSFDQIAIVNSLWNGVSMVFVALAGFFIFKEKPTINEIVAIFLIVIAAILIGLK